MHCSTKTHWFVEIGVWQIGHASCFFRHSAQIIWLSPAHVKTGGFATSLQIGHSRVWKEILICNKIFYLISNFRLKYTPEICRTLIQYQALSRGYLHELGVVRLRKIWQICRACTTFLLCFQFICASGITRLARHDASVILLDPSLNSQC